MLGKRIGMALVFLVFLTLAWMNWNVVDRVRVNGPVYQKMVMGKDLLADSLPPPSYLLQAYHTVVQLALAGANEPKELERLLESYEKSKKEFESRHQYWLEHLSEPLLKEKELAEYQSGKELLESVDQSLFPLLKSGKNEAILNCLNSTITPKYRKHLECVNELVAATVSYNQQVELEAKQAVEYCKIILASYLLLTLSSIAAWRFYRVIARYIA